MSESALSPRRLTKKARKAGASVLLLGSVSACDNLDRYGPSGSANTPAAPTALVAVPASSSEIALAWTAPATTGGTFTYRLYRGGAELGTTESTFYADEGLSPSTAYIYTVMAVDQFGQASQHSNPAGARTLDQGQTDAEPPSIPAGLTAVPGSSTAISLSWTASTDNVGVLGYRIYRGGIEIGTTSGTWFDDQGLSPSTQYTYTVAAFDAAGNLSAQSNPASATTLAQGQSDTEAPTVPLLVVAVPSGPTSVQVVWSPSTDNTGVLGYRVFRDGVEIATTSTPLYADSSLTPSTEYNYTVAAFDAAGNESAQSNPASATTLGVGESDTQAPAVPLLAAAVPTGSTSTLVTWLPSTDNVGVLGYQVFRDGVQIATTPGPVYADSSLTPSTMYTYAVAAFDAAGNVSPQSAGAITTTLPDLGLFRRR